MTQPSQPFQQPPPAAEPALPLLAPAEPYCPRCDHDDHRCPGCGVPVPHGTVACATCNAEPGETRAHIMSSSPGSDVPPPVPVELDPVAAAWVEAIRVLDAHIAPLQSQLNTLAEQRERAVWHVQAALGDAVEGRIGGRPVVTWKPSKPAMQLDRQRLVADLGAERVASYLVPKKAARPFRLLDPKGGAE